MKLLQRQSSWFFYFLPALIIYIVFTIFPIANSLRMSFFQGSGFNLDTFVGFENYRRLFFDPLISENFWNAFGNTWVFFLVHMLVQNTLGILFANLLLAQTGKWGSFYRTMIFLPSTLAILVTGFLWKLLLNPQWGVITMIAAAIHPELAQPWLGNSESALITISLISSWQWVGIPTMIFLASLQSIPNDLFEAAAIDGVTWWQVFWYIKLPLVRPIIGVVAILTFTGNFNAFDIVFAMAGINGGPVYSTDILGTYFYRIGIAGEHPVGIPNVGLGATVASLVFLFLFLGVMLIRVFTRERN